ncbi:MAG: hypothetical protein HQL93_02005 [Magnetococcales bacterium]|nr:hypothetical protein [Magnetococcales bacterium]
MNIAILDTNVIIKLRKAMIIDYLGGLFDKIIVPEAVKNECMDYFSKIELNKSFFEIVCVSKLLKISGIGLGELEVISIAVERNIPVICTDDKKATKKALQYNLIPLTTYSLLVFFKKKGLIKSVKKYLDLMLANGEFFENELYVDILRLAGETN